MARVITFSRTFPNYHPRAGEPTFFVEKIWESIYLQGDHPIWLGENYTRLTELLPGLKSVGLHSIHVPKHHTIRAGNRWKVGDWFSPRVWSGKPYNSKQIQFAPDIQVKKTWKYDMRFVRVDGELNLYAFVNENLVDTSTAERIAANDGLSMQGFTDWFVKSGQKFIVNVPIFDGQIFCWNETVDY